MSRELLTEIQHEGHIWRVYADGFVEGFPENSVVVNYAAMLLAQVRYSAAFVKSEMPKVYRGPTLGGIGNAVVP